MWRQDTNKAAEPRARISRRGLRWALEGIVCQHLTVARAAEGLGVSWHTATIGPGASTGSPCSASMSMSGATLDAVTRASP